MINRMAERSLISKRNNGNDRRSAEVLLAPGGKAVLLRLVTGAAELQTALLAPLAAGIAGHRSPVREVTGFQSECFDSNFRKRSVRLNSFIRRHHGRNDCHGLGRISFGHEKDRANRWAAA